MKKAIRTKVKRGLVSQARNNKKRDEIRRKIGKGSPVGERPRIMPIKPQPKPGDRKRKIPIRFKDRPKPTTPVKIGGPAKPPKPLTRPSNLNPAQEKRLKQLKVRAGIKKALPSKISSSIRKPMKSRISKISTSDGFIRRPARKSIKRTKRARRMVI